MRRKLIDPPADAATDLAALTPREIAVFTRIAAGKNSREIADALNISTFAVHRDTSSVIDKIGARTQAEAIAKTLGALDRRRDEGARPRREQSTPADRDMPMGRRGEPGFDGTDVAFGLSQARHGDPGHVNDCVPVAFQGLEELHPDKRLVDWRELGVVGSAGVSGGRIAAALGYRPPGFAGRAAVVGELAGRGVGADAVMFEVYGDTGAGHAVLLVHQGGGRVVVREVRAGVVVYTDFDEWAKGRVEPAGVWATLVDEGGDVVEGLGDPDSLLPLDPDFGRNPDGGQRSPSRSNDDDVGDSSTAITVDLLRVRHEAAVVQRMGALKDRQDAAVLVDEVFRRAGQRMGEIAGIDDVRGWIDSIADHVMSLNPREVAPYLRYRRAVAAEASGAQRRILAEASDHDFDTAMQTLGDRERGILTLLFLGDGVPIDVIARSLGASVRDVRNMVRRILRRLARKLGAVAADTEKSPTAEATSAERIRGETRAQRRARWDSASLLLVIAVFDHRKELLQPHLVMLDDAEREYFKLYFEDRKSFTTIARELGFHKSTVQWRLNQIGRFLAERLPAELREQYGRAGILRHTTAKDVAREAGVGVRTARAVLHEENIAKLPTAQPSQRIRAISDRMGWSPDRGRSSVVLCDGVDIEIPLLPIRSVTDSVRRGQSLRAVRAAHPDDVARCIPNLAVGERKIAELLFRQKLALPEVARRLERDESVINTYRTRLANDVHSLLSGGVLLTNSAAWELIRGLRLSDPEVLEPHLPVLSETQRAYFDLFFGDPPMSEQEIATRRVVGRDGVQQQLRHAAHALVRKLDPDFVERQANTDVRAWVRAAQQGDAEAFGRLSDRYAQAMFLTVMSLVDDREAAESITAAAVRHAQAGIGSLGDEQQVRAWFMDRATEVAAAVSDGRAAYFRPETDAGSSAAGVSRAPVTAVAQASATDNADAEKRRARQRDREINEERRNRYGRDIFGHIMRCLGVRQGMRPPEPVVQRAQEINQAVFRIAESRRWQVPGEGDVTGWLRSIADDEVKGLRARRGSIADLLASPHGAASSNPSRQAVPVHDGLVAHTAPEGSIGEREAGHVANQCGRLVLELLGWVDPDRIPTVGAAGMVVKDIVRIAGADPAHVRRCAIDPARPHRGVVDALLALPEEQREGASALVFDGFDKADEHGVAGHVFRLVVRGGKIHIEDPGKGVFGRFEDVVDPDVLADLQGVWAVGFDREGNPLDLPGTQADATDLEFAVGLSHDTIGDQVLSVVAEAGPQWLARLSRIVKVRHVPTWSTNSHAFFLPEALTNTIETLGVDLVVQTLGLIHENRHALDFEDSPWADVATMLRGEYVHAVLHFEARAYAEEALVAMALHARGHEVPDDAEEYTVFAEAYGAAVADARQVQPEATTSELATSGYRAGVHALEEFFAAPDKHGKPRKYVRRPGGNGSVLVARLSARLCTRRPHRSRRRKFGGPCWRGLPPIAISPRWTARSSGNSSVGARPRPPGSREPILGAVTMPRCCSVI